MPNIDQPRIVLGNDGRYWEITYTSAGVDYGNPISQSELSALRRPQGSHPHDAAAHRHHGSRQHNSKASSKTKSGASGPPQRINSWSGEVIPSGDGMADNPLAQAIFHGPGRASMYYAPYQVYGFASYPVALAFFASPALPLSVAILSLSKAHNPAAFVASEAVLRDFLLGSRDRVRAYGPNSVETQSLNQSDGFRKMLARIRKQVASGVTSGNESTGSWRALSYIPYDLVHSPVGGQVGGDLATWRLDNGRLYITTTNDAGANSFFFHAVPNLPDDMNGPLNTIHQTFHSDVPVK